MPSKAVEVVVRRVTAVNDSVPGTTGPGHAGARAPQRGAQKANGTNNRTKQENQGINEARA